MMIRSSTTAWPRQVEALEYSTILVHPMQNTQVDELDTEELQQRLDQDGYLFLRSFLPVELMDVARQTLANDLASNKFISNVPGNLDPLLLSDTCLKDDSMSPQFLSRMDLQRHSKLLSVFEHPKLKNTMSILLRSSPDSIETHRYKWLRAVGPNLFTGLHFDQTYFPSTSFPKLLTAWIPLDHISTDLGSLIIASPNSYWTESLPRLELGTDGTKSGWFDESFLQDRTIRWLSADMKRGDVVIIDPTRCLHMSSRNVKEPKQWRLSADTRWWAKNNS